MSSETAICFENVSKVFSKGESHHGTLRDDLRSLFSKKGNPKTLTEDQFFAIKNLTFTISKGESVGLYGPNGSGKSTLLKLIANVLVPTSGTVDINGRIAPLIELGAGFHQDLTGKENIYMNAAILGMSILDINKIMPDVIKFSGLESFIDVPVKKYSSGMYLRLAFSVAIHSKASIFLFDEIISVGDAEFQQKCFDKIDELIASGKTILLVSHDLSRMKQIVQRIIPLKKGEITDTNL